MESAAILRMRSSVRCPAHSIEVISPNGSIRTPLCAYPQKPACKGSGAATAPAAAIACHERPIGTQGANMNQRPVVNVQTFLNEHPFSGFQWLVFALCFVIVLLDGFDTAAIGYIAPSLVKEWGVARPALGPVLSAALFGLAFGALGSGPLSDRLGRRVLLVSSVLVFGVACLGSAFSASLEQLTILRFVTGLGLGAAMPNAVTMMSEYCPDNRRATLTNLMFCGFPLGAAFGGFLAAWMIPQFGWRSVLILGGVAPLVLTVVMFLTLPESVRYMVAKGQSVEKIRAALRRVSKAADQASTFVMTELAAHSGTTKSGLGLVLSGPFIVGSLMLWLAYFMGLVVFYALINWMPILFKDAGIDPKTATLISALFPLGGVGAVVFGVLMDRFNPNRVIAIGYALTAVAVFGIGQTIGSVGLLMVVVFIAGILMNTAQSSMPALAAPFYPTQGRATGVAWMLGIGRFGGIAGSFLVAELTRRNVALNDIFTIVAVAGVIAALALLVKQAVNPQPGATEGARVEFMGH
jgi:AAHS family 4-hydroxybenzoate transporter-like MFS transporter